VAGFAAPCPCGRALFFGTAMLQCSINGRRMRVLAWQAVILLAPSDEGIGALGPLVHEKLRMGSCAVAPHRCRLQACDRIVSRSSLVGQFVVRGRIRA